MKNKLFVSLAFVTTLLVSAQQKNTLLESTFWKTKPDVNTVKAEIEKGNDPAGQTANAFDVTVMAINNDAPEATIKYLLEQPGNEVSKLTHDNRIYLHWAANKGNTAIVEHLISKGSDINLEDSKGETPLTFAAIGAQSNTALYEAFFKAGTDPKKKYRDGVNLMHMAIAGDKSLALTNYFTSKGMSLKDTDADGNTAFDYAARSGNIALLKSLIEKGVKYTNNALLFAAQGSRREVTSLETYKYLVEDLKLKPTTANKNGETVLHFLAGKPNQIEIINYFLSKGVPVNTSNNEGNTPLIVAAAARDIAALELLLPLVSNINAQNEKGESALTIAVKSGTPEAVTALLNKGANPKVLDKDQNNLGYYLIQSYRPMTGKPENANGSVQDPFDLKMKFLQEKGLDMVAPQKDGSTLIHFAVAKNDLGLVKKLSSLPIDLNSKNKDGLTALHKAAMIAKDDVMLKYLLSIGVKKDITTEFDETAYSLAKENETLTTNKIDLEFLK
ncbi:ankyrin repeat domain-containing protein [Flavobacterium sp. SOK18b]|uniref:ankyrin repeat domain-containing protein n=1 Tax=Flavobacterium sp. SOK18b TaxID=797900 RepID=UPI0015FB1266|nr:ankyrin repeat domain-containing protein [Flavobacterium sp. SOK18b]MBB1192309.1 ankyrin repeat domain-containing protein [Flavobacterium sp. SOK18b]